MNINLAIIAALAIVTIIVLFFVFKKPTKENYTQDEIYGNMNSVLRNLRGMESPDESDKLLLNHLENSIQPENYISAKKNDRMVTVGEDHVKFANRKKFGNSKIITDADIEENEKLMNSLSKPEPMFKIHRSPKKIVLDRYGTNVSFAADEGKVRKGGSNSIKVQTAAHYTIPKFNSVQYNYV